MSVCLLVYLKNDMSKLHENVLYMLPVAVARSFSEENAIRYVLPVWRMTLYLPIMGYMARG